MRKYIFILITVFGLVGLVACPSEAIAASREAIELCRNVIIPTLFPFLVFSSLAVAFGLADILGKIFEVIMKPIFNVNGTCSIAFILGLISGFPVGAKTTISLYQNGLCTKPEAERLLSFSNNAGPAFILGTVGIGIWNSNRIGWLLWGINIISSVTVGFIFGKLWKNKEHDQNKSSAVKKRRNVVSFFPTLTDSVKNAASNLIYISSFIVFFAIIIKLLTISGIIPTAAKIFENIFFFSKLTATDYENIISGIFEFTTGIKKIGNSGSFSQNLTMTAAILSWAGMSVHCQVLTFIYESGLSPMPYIIGKALQTIFSASIMFLISNCILKDKSVSAFAAHTDILNYDGISGFRLCILSTVIIIFLTIAIFFFSQNGKNREK